MTVPMQAAAGPLARRIGSEIRAEIARQGLSQAGLAERIGKDQPWVSRRITGTVPVNATDLELIAVALGVPVSQLLPAAEPTTDGAR